MENSSIANESWYDWILRVANDPITISVIAASSAVVYSTLRSSIDRRLALQESFKLMDEDRRYRFSLFAVSTVNAVWLSAFGILKTVRPFPIHDKVSYLVMSTGLGYFVYDLAATQRHWKKYPVDLVHHLFALFLCGGALYSNKGLQEAPFFCLLEMSTVLINVSWMMRELDKKGVDKRLAYKLIMAAFAILFAYFRVFEYGKRIVQYETGVGITSGSEADRLRQDYLKMPDVTRISYKGAYVLQLFWFIKILGNVKSLLKAKSQ